MCISVHRSEKVKIASRNVKVYKRLTIKDNGKLVSPYLETYYQIGKDKTAIGGFNRTLKEFENKKKHWIIIDLDEGIHSYSSEKTALNNRLQVYNEDIFLAVIPKGARYLIGQYDEVISDKLRIVKRLTTWGGLR